MLRATKRRQRLKGLTGLSVLQLNGATGVTSLEPLSSLTSLSTLHLSRATKITNLEPLKGLTNLRYLDISFDKISSLESAQRPDQPVDS
jgi:internalin A